MSSKKMSADDPELRSFERRYQRLRRGLARIGYLLNGSLVVRKTVCGQPTCRCHKGVRFHHGPYYWWTSKIAGKTVTVILSDQEGKLYVTWVKNRRRVEAILKQMYRVSAQVARAMFGQPPPWFRK